MADVIAGGVASHFDDTQMDLVLSLVQKELKGANKLDPYVNDVSSFHMKGAKSISFPKLSSFTAVNRAAGSAGDATALDDAIDKLDLNLTPFVSFLIDSQYGPLTTINAQVEYAQRAGAAMGRYIENAIATELNSAAGFSTGAALPTYDGILDMREFLMQNEAEDLVIYTSVDHEKEFWKIDEFKRFDINGASPGPIQSGMIGSILGIPVVMSSLRSGETYMFDRSAVAVGMAQEIRTARQPEIQYGSSAERIVYDAILGVKACQTEVNGLGAGESALIAKVSV